MMTGRATFLRHLHWVGIAMFLLLAVSAERAFASGETTTTNAEIAHLMKFLRSSGCDFNRNGSWYVPAEAHDHILKKLDYLRGRATIPSAEYFIRDAASRSSMSGKLYQVRCPGTPVQECRTWLSDELKLLRSRP